MVNADELITLKKAAKISQLTPRHIRLLMSQEKIWGMKLGRDWFTTEEAIQEYLAQYRKPGPKPK
jgi:hypothetical protein